MAIEENGENMAGGRGRPESVMEGERPTKSRFECLWKALEEGEMGAGGRYLGGSGLTFTC